MPPLQQGRRAFEIFKHQFASVLIKDDNLNPGLSPRRAVPAGGINKYKGERVLCQP